MRLQLKERADAEAIRVFAENLRHLLLAAPLGGRRVLALDPGFRTGCKMVALDETGKLLENGVVYPHEPQRQAEGARKEVVRLVARHKLSAVAIGNGTAGRETEAFVRAMKKDGPAARGAAWWSRSTRAAPRSTPPRRSRARSSPTRTSPCAARCRSGGACRTRWPSW